jgi:hypothetical protein
MMQHAELENGLSSIVVRPHAFGDFQPQGEVIKVLAEEAKQIFPTRATALLCASSADEIARAPKEGNFTMFSGALVDVLKRGSIDYGEHLTLAQVYDLVNDKIIDSYQAEGIRPEIYTPDQKEGDLSRVPFFQIQQNY